MYHIFFIHSSVFGYLGYFHVLAIVNTAAMNIGVHIPFQIMVFSGFIPRSDIVGSYGSSNFSFLRNLSYDNTYVESKEMEEMSLFTKQK